jgi:hypothetical protein
VNDFFRIYHEVATGHIRLVAYNNVGVNIYTDTFGAWLPTSGTEYEFELSMSSAQAIRLYINGVQSGATKTTSFTRGTSAVRLYIGSDGTDTDGSFDDLIWFSTVKHTANYTPGYSVEKYSISNPTIEGTASWMNEGLDGFTETKIVSGSDEIKYILKKGTVWYWWNGTAWAVSAGTYAQSNTAEDIETNKATFCTAIATSKFKAFLHSDDGSTTPQLDKLVIQYNFGGESPDAVSKTIVYGYAVKIDGTASTATVRANLNKGSTKYKTKTTIIAAEKTDTPDTSNGYWELELVDTTNMETGVYYIFNVDGRAYKTLVTVAEYINFWDLNPVEI